MPRKRVLSVGQCSYDHGQITRHLDRAFAADVEGADSHAQALEAVRTRGPFGLVLVNRVGDRDGAPGLTLIEALKADPATAAIPVMLVSNYADAQAQAQERGALPGFGKAELGKPEADTRIAAALAAADQPGAGTP